MTTFQIRGRESLQEKILSALDNQFTVTEQDIDMVAFAPLTKLIINSERKSKQKGLEENGQVYLPGYQPEN